MAVERGLRASQLRETEFLWTRRGLSGRFGILLGGIMKDSVELTVNLLTLLSILGGALLFLKRSAGLAIGQWEENFIDDIFETASRNLVELRALSALDPVSQNPGEGQISANELLLRTWQVEQSIENLHYRSLAYGSNPKFPILLEKIVVEMKDAYRQLANRDATGLNRMKFQMEHMRLDFLEAVDRGDAYLRNRRTDFVARERERIAKSYTGYLD